jgi:pimeloyl-ACP methyl ester carboxylesterase
VHVEETLKQRNLPEVYYWVAKYNLTDLFNGISMGTEEIYKIKVPTILAHGSDDLLVSVDAARFTQKCLGEQAQLVVWDECGHSPFVDRLPELVELIKS